MHTPGPWFVLIDDDGCPLEIVLAGDHDMRIAVPASDGPLANARLIAAAPELLAALREVIAVSDRKTEIYDRARAAIAKAEGRTP